MKFVGTLIKSHTREVASCQFYGLSELTNNLPVIVMECISLLTNSLNKKFACGRNESVN